MIGRTISHYRIEAELGRGGMGVVYRATDLSLHRPVAIKFLSSEVATEERRRRFQQEAQTASSLNHPHILTVFDAGTIDGEQYLVTEFIDGCTLREWAKRETPSVRQIVELVTSIADALACAHQAGILHRDIKPENILISKDGYAKLVDFGLAKLLETAPSPGSATRTMDAAVETRAGVVVGTIPYMSPEQIGGKPVDGRSDIFSFGVVLYELLAGRRPFGGEADPQLIHEIRHSPPRPVRELRPDTPYALSIAVEKALEKEPGDRYQSARELVVDLRRVQRVPSSDAAIVPVPPAPRRVSWMLASIAALILLGLAWLGWRMRPSESASRNPLTNARFTRLTDFAGSELDASISPDGKFVVFLSDWVGVFDLWATQTESGEFFNLTKGQFSGLYQEEVRNIGFSGDGTLVWLLTGATDSTGGARISTQLVPILGGAPRPFLEKKLNPLWSPDGNRIVYHETTPGDPIFIADRTGSNPKMLFTEEPGLHCHYLTFSPDGRFVYFVRGVPPDEMDIWRISVGGGEPERITHHNSRVSYPAMLNQRTLMYSASGEDGSGPWLYSIDVERRVAQRASLGVELYTSLSASADGRRLVATVSNPIGDLWTVPVSGSKLEESEARRFTLPTTRAVAPQFGPDYLLYLSSKGSANGLWRFQNGTARELWRAVEGGLTAAPAISPNGQDICFSVQKQGRTGLYLMSADGTNVRALAPSLDIRGTASWSPDGKWIATTGKSGRGYRVFKVAVDTGSAVQLVDKMSSSPVWSPDGRYIVYAEHQQGPTSLLKAVTPEKQSFPVPRLSVRREVDHSRFLPNSNSLIVLQGERQRQNFWQVDFTADKRQQLTNLKPGSSIKSFDISPDGKQILFDRVQENSDIVLIDLPQ